MSHAKTPQDQTSCLSEYGLDRHLLGQETEAQRAVSLAHIATCEACRADAAAWKEAAALPAPLPGHAPGPSLWEQVTQWIGQGPMVGAAALAAVAIITVVAWQQLTPDQPTTTPSGRHSPTPTPPPPAWRIKGSKAPLLLVKRTRQGKQTTLRKQGYFRKGDEVQIQYKWLAGRFVSILHLDPKANITPLFPAKAGPSAPIHQGGLQSLPDAFAVTGPAAGDEEIWACFSTKALPWRKIQKAIPTLKSPYNKPPKRRPGDCLWKRFVMKRKAP